MITVEIDSSRIQAELNQLLQRSGNLAPALREIGEDLKESTQQRFASQTAPDGSAWLGNADTTIARKGRSQPLTEHGTLGNTIGYQLLGGDGVQIGSPLEYAAMMQFGGTQSEFPNLWGDIPARPFLGISSEDEDNILALLARHLQN
ncbi:MAG: phage virion morphogenesis protein [Methylobacter sp.]|uniref:Phage virion morphogenesis protein n=1 Tax=Candidatus Methylobacter titanis TaxID=3053457 RepID=A0AA43TKK5_9GAMM|nr:phage virion morphogenesis protein [Candidatus Methylobacter titanis]